MFLSTILPVLLFLHFVGGVLTTLYLWAELDMRLAHSVLGGLIWPYLLARAAYRSVKSGSLRGFFGEFDEATGANPNPDTGETVTLKMIDLTEKEIKVTKVALDTLVGMLDGLPAKGEDEIFDLVVEAFEEQIMIEGDVIKAVLTIRKKLTE